MLTDKDIIKALECCMDGTGRINCENCPLTNEYCRKELPRLSLLLIRTLQTEIERLKNMVAQNEGVLPEYENLIKAEAIKEFAEKLKPKLSVYDEVYVDNLVKEMVGEE